MLSSQRLGKVEAEHNSACNEHGVMEKVCADWQKPCGVVKSTKNIIDLCNLFALLTQCFKLRDKQSALQPSNMHA